MIAKTLQCRQLSTFQNLGKLCTTLNNGRNEAPEESTTVRDLTFILRNKSQSSWKYAISNLNLKLQPRHVDKVLLQTLDNPRRQIDGVVVLKLMLENDIVPEVRTLSTLFHALIGIRRFSLVLELYDQIFSGFRNMRPDVYVCTAVIRCLCECRKVDRALEVVHMMEESGCELSVVTYNVLIRGLCKNQRALEGVDIKSSLGRKGLTADVITYCTLVLGLCQAEEYLKALEMTKEMLQLGLVPSEGVVPTLVEGLRKKGEVMDAFSLVDELARHKVVPNVVVYTALINSIWKDGKLKQAESLFMSMEQRGLIANEVTYLAMIDLFCKQGRLDDGLSLLAKMSETKVKITDYVYNSLIHVSLGS